MAMLEGSARACGDGADEGEKPSAERALDYFAKAELTRDDMALVIKALNARGLSPDFSWPIQCCQYAPFRSSFAMRVRS
jgi:hypothetical protein